MTPLEEALRALVDRHAEQGREAGLDPVNLALGVRRALRETDYYVVKEHFLRALAAQTGVDADRLIAALEKIDGEAHSVFAW